MHPKKRALSLNILFGGIAVLASYYFGLNFATGNLDALWGGIPAGVRPYFPITMLLGAAGFFAFTSLILFQLDAERTRLFSCFGYGALQLIYALILIPSALWLPLTLLAFDQASPLILWSARLVLILVAAASLAMLGALITLEPRQKDGFRKLAVLGSGFFCIQTVLLDAALWSILIRV